MNTMLQQKNQRRLALLGDLECPRPEVLEKTVVLFHDESTFQANDDQPILWTAKGSSVMRLKSKGSDIMVSDFICERGGYLSGRA